MGAEAEFKRRNFQLAQLKYDHALNKYVKATIDDLEDTIRQPPDELPKESIAEGWNAVHSTLEHEIDRCTSLLPSDPNAAMQFVWRVRASYWSRSLRSAINWTRSNPEHSNAATRLQALEGFAPQFDALAAAPEVEPEKVLELERKIQVLNPQYAEARAKSVGAAEAASSSPDLLSYLPVIHLFPSTGMESIRLSDTKALGRLRRWNEFVILFLSAIVAILLGLKLLWIDNVVWGTCNDCLVAILWGLGLHQVASASFDFNSYVVRLTKPSAPAE
jgi:hypothetical protein